MLQVPGNGPRPLGGEGGAQRRVRGSGGRSNLRGPLESERKRRAFSDFSLGPDAPSVPADNPLHRCQADPVPIKLVLRVQPLKRAEKIVGICHIKPRAIVADEENRLAILLAVRQTRCARWAACS